MKEGGGAGSDRDAAGVRKWLRGGEDAVLGISLLLMAVIPTVEFFGRRYFSTGIPDAANYLGHLTLWVGFVGAMAAARGGEHLRIVPDGKWLPGSLQPTAAVFQALFSSLVCVALSAATIELVVSEAPGLPESVAAFLPAPLLSWLEPFGLLDAGNPSQIGGWLPVWAAEAVMAVVFVVIALRFLSGAPLKFVARLLLFSAVVGGVILLGIPEEFSGTMVVLGFVVSAAAAAAGEIGRAHV